MKGAQRWISSPFVERKNEVSSFKGQRKGATLQEATLGEVA